VQLALDHYTKVKTRQEQLDEAVQRAEEHKAARAKLKAAPTPLEAAAALAHEKQQAHGLGTVDHRKPFLAADLNKLRNTQPQKQQQRRSSITGESGASASGVSSDVASRQRTSSQSPERGEKRASGSHGSGAPNRHVIEDEMRNLGRFLNDDKSGLRPLSKPAALHHALRQLDEQRAHDTLIASSKAAFNISSDKRIRVDLHALHRKDIFVHKAELEEMVHKHSLDEIVQNRVDFPLPQPSVLLADETGALQQALHLAPSFAVAEAPPPKKLPPRIRHSETFQVTQRRLEAQLRHRDVESIMADAIVDLRKGGVGDGTAAAAQALEQLVASFEPEVPSSSLLAIESGEWKPETYPQATPRLGSPPKTRRTLAQSQSQPAMQQMHQQQPRGAAAATATASGARGASAVSRPVKTPVAIYSVDDPSIDALREFNCSVEATYAREHEFAHAFRATGKEKRVRDTDTRPAARPSHPLAPQRINSLADVAPAALNKQWPLLDASASLAHSTSTPLLLMPGESPARKQQQHRAAAYKDDSSIFDLTSVDAQDEVQTADASPVASDDEDKTLPLDSQRRRELLGSLVADAVARADDAVAAVQLSHRSIEAPDASSSASPSPSRSPSKSLIVSGGVELPSLALEGLGSGAPADEEEDLSSVGTGFVVEESLRPLAPSPFPAGMPSRAQMMEEAWLSGFTLPMEPKLLTRSQLKADAAELQQAMFQAARQSTAFAGHANTHSPAFKAKQKAMMAWTAKQAYVNGLIEKQAAMEANSEEERRWWAEYERHRLDADAAASADNDDEVWDADDAAASAPSDQRLRKSSSAPRLRVSVGALPACVPAYGSPPAHATLPRSPPKAAMPQLGLSGSPLSSSLSASQSLASLPAVKRLSRPSSSKHGHPARIAPAHMSLSSADVPAMTWLQEKIRATETAAALGSESLTQPRAARPGSAAQSIARAIAAPLASFVPPTSTSSPNQRNKIVTSPVHAASAMGDEHARRHKHVATKNYFKAPATSKQRGQTRGAARSLHMQQLHRQQQQLLQQQRELLQQQEYMSADAALQQSADEQAMMAADATAPDSRGDAPDGGDAEHATMEQFQPEATESPPPSAAEADAAATFAALLSDPAEMHDAQFGDVDAKRPESSARTNSVSIDSAPQARNDAVAALVAPASSSAVAVPSAVLGPVRHMRSFTMMARLNGAGFGNQGTSGSTLPSLAETTDPWQGRQATRARAASEQLGVPQHEEAKEERTAAAAAFPPRVDRFGSSSHSRTASLSSNGATAAARSVSSTAAIAEAEATDETANEASNPASEPTTGTSAIPALRTSSIPPLARAPTLSQLPVPTRVEQSVYCRAKTQPFINHPLHKF
jgi:hypothetical protein